ncbi:MAG TPA: iron-containing alcohol dehydrogenase [Burkholderiaceae bacterium]|nr:iron-containing alcohol dehydrogenase [Burkholderiaceae bacterium]
MTVDDLDYTLFGTHVVLRDGAARQLADELDALGLSRPVILSQTRMAASPVYASLRATLSNLESLEITAIPAHSSVSLIETVTHQIKDFAPDCIVAIGGGSVSDSAKALAMLIAEGGALADHATTLTATSTVIVPKRTQPKLPIISLPTTASGAEVTPSLGVSDGHEKLLFWNRALCSTSILIDPCLSADIPLSIMHATAMNGIAHCLEGLYSRSKSRVSDALAMQATESFVSALTDESLDEPAQRRALLLAGHMSGMVLSMARSCLHHAICHVLGARHGIGHGIVNSIMLPHTIRYNETESTVRDDLSPVLALVNRHHPAQPFDSVSAWLAHLAQSLSLPDRLSLYGLTDDDLDAAANLTMKERGLAINPLPVRNASQIKSILRNAL